MNYSSEDIRKKYDQCAGSYDRWLGFIERISAIQRMRKNLIQQAIGSVLAVAIGTGRDLRHYKEDCAITGIDLSEKMLEKAKETAEKLGRTVTLKSMDAESMTFSDNSFDTVVSTLALCTFPNPYRALAEMRRVCTPNGKILFLEHGRSKFNIWARVQRWMEPRHMRKHGCYLTREPAALVQESGMIIRDYQTSRFGVWHVITASPGKSA